MSSRKQRSTNRYGTTKRPENQSSLTRTPARSSDVSRKTQIAYAHHELKVLSEQITTAKKQLEALRQDRLKAQFWTESREERTLRTQIELRKLRRRNVSRWLARTTGQNSGKPTKGSAKSGRRTTSKRRRGPKAIKGITPNGTRTRARLIG